VAVGTQTVAFSDSRDSEWIDTSGRYRVRFVFGMEWSGRFEPNCLGSTRGARYESAVKTVRIAALYTLAAWRGGRSLAVSNQSGSRTLAASTAT